MKLFNIHEGWGLADDVVKKFDIINNPEKIADRDVEISFDDIDRPFDAVAFDKNKQTVMFSDRFGHKKNVRIFMPFSVKGPSQLGSDEYRSRFYPPGSNKDYFQTLDEYFTLFFGKRPEYLKSRDFENSLNSLVFLMLYIRDYIKNNKDKNLNNQEILELENALKGNLLPKRRGRKPKAVSSSSTGFSGLPVASDKTKIAPSVTPEPKTVKTLDSAEYPYEYRQNTDGRYGWYKKNTSEIPIAKAVQPTPMPVRKYFSKDNQLDWLENPDNDKEFAEWLNQASYQEAMDSYFVITRSKYLKPLADRYYNIKDINDMKRRKDTIRSRLQYIKKDTPKEAVFNYYLPLILEAIDEANDDEVAKLGYPYLYYNIIVKQDIFLDKLLKNSSPDTNQNSIKTYFKRFVQNTISGYNRSSFDEKMLLANDFEKYYNNIFKKKVAGIDIRKFAQYIKSETDMDDDGYSNSLNYSLVHKTYRQLKEPDNAVSENARDELINKSVEVFVNDPEMSKKKFDYIVVLGSAADFNRLLSNKLLSHYTNAQPLTIPKLPEPNKENRGINCVSFDVDEYLDYIIDIMKQENVGEYSMKLQAKKEYVDRDSNGLFQLTPDGVKYYTNQNNYQGAISADIADPSTTASNPQVNIKFKSLEQAAEARTMEKWTFVSKLFAQRGKGIKNIPSSLRPFLKLFDLENLPTSQNGKQPSLLVIDDNVSTGGSFVAFYRDMIFRNPDADYTFFSPLLIVPRK